MTGIEVPDWVRAEAIIGLDSLGEYHVLVVDDDGNLVAIMKGSDAGTLRPVKVDSTGQIYVLIKGPNGENIAVDASGFISAVLKGNDAGTLRTLVVDSSGNLVSVIKGSDAGTLRTIAVDGTGQLYVLIKGSSGESVAVDASGYLSAILKGNDSGTLRTLAVDSSGNLVTLVKGTYGATLKTLSTDADGRLQIVPYDSADVWGNTIGIGNAELAAVMSPVKRYDRRGNVIWWTDFEDGLGEVVTAAVGASADICLSCYRRLSGSYSCKIKAGSDSTHKGTLTRILPFPVAGKMGIEAAFSIDTDAESFTIALYFDDGVHYGYGMLLWEESTDDLKVRTGVATWTTVDANKNLYTNLNTFHKMKVVVDFVNWKYVRANVNEESYDLSAYSMYNTGTLSEGLSFAQVEFIGESGKNAVCYVDGVILTQNEPA